MNLRAVSKSKVKRTFINISFKLGSAVKKLTAENEDVLSKPIVSKQLDHVYWEKIKAINDVFTQQYSIRKSMLLKRLDVTIDSFGWSERAKVFSLFVA